MLILLQELLSHHANPTTLLGPVAQVVRNAGGIFIADEVQSCFGRTGARFWGYQLHGIVPDIVIIGKPMGNGFPVVAVALSPSVIERFGRDTRYFNTFGGNNVAIAAAQATFDVIRDAQLILNAQRVGETIQTVLRQLQKSFPAIGDVRGSGLYVGVEMVVDQDSKAPNSAAALAIVNGLRERRVLISATSFNSNILKIRPPLVFSMADADRLLTQLEFVLRSVLDV